MASYTREFHGVVLSMWEEARQSEPTFGTYNSRTEYDIESDKKSPWCCLKMGF